MIAVILTRTDARYWSCLGCSRLASYHKRHCRGASRFRVAAAFSALWRSQYLRWLRCLDLLDLACAFWRSCEKAACHEMLAFVISLSCTPARRLLSRAESNPRRHGPDARPFWRACADPRSGGCGRPCPRPRLLQAEP